MIISFSKETALIEQKMKKQNVDTAELDKFSAHASTWWDVNGDLWTLHQINPLRLHYIKSKVSLEGKRVIDIGCGGGILSESMAQAGAHVTGIDMTQSVIDIAKLHLLESKLDVTYRCQSAESAADSEANTYDVITCLEMLEHVPNPKSIVSACEKLLKPGGHIFFSTINRNPKAYLFAIIGAEYLLKLLPKNTHDYSRFIRPAELADWVRTAGLLPSETTGITYHPLTRQFSLTRDISVNYILYAWKPHE